MRYYYKGERRVENLLPLSTSRNARVVNVSDVSVELAWDGSLSKLNDIEDKVQYRADNGEWQTSPTVCRGREATISGLQPNTTYTIRLHSNDQIFLREFVGEYLKIKTQPASSFSSFPVIYGSVFSVVLGLIFCLVKR